MAATHALLGSATTHAATTLVWAVLLLLFPLSAVIGSAATVAALLLTLLLTPLAISRDAWAELRAQPAVLIFIAVIVALAICFIITARTAHDPIYALNFLSLPLAAIFFLALQRRPGGAPDARIVLTWLCLAACLVATLVAVNDIIVRDVARVRGFNMGPHVLARIVLVFAFAALALVMASTSRWRFLAYLGLPLALAVLYLSETRGAVVALIPMLAVYLAFLFVRREDRLQMWIIAALCAAAFVLLLTVSDRLGDLIVMATQIISEGASDNKSAAARFDRLGAAWDLFWHAPLLGHGWANFTELAYPLLGDGIKGGADDRWFQFHNDLANFAVAAGAVGVVCWLALLAAPIVGALATPRDRLFRARLYVCVQLTVSYFVFGLTDITFGYDLPTALYAFLTAIVLATWREPAARPVG